MTLLATLLPMLASGTEFTFTVSKSGDGLRVVTLPKLKDFKPDTDDAELAALQAALCQPLVFTVTDGQDPDNEFARLLAQAVSVRNTTVDRLEAYQDAQRQAQQTANAEAAKKAEKKALPAPSAAKGKAAAKPDKSPKGAKGGASTPLTDVAGEPGEEAASDQESQSDTTETPDAEAAEAPAATSGTIDLFSNSEGGDQ